MSRNNHDVSEEKLKELQRKEALMNSDDEYDIQDNTYDRAPITRQYVKDDVVVKGSQFVDDDEDDIIIVAPNTNTTPTLDAYDEDIIVIAEPPETPVIKNEPSIEDKYTKQEPQKEAPKPQDKPKNSEPTNLPSKYKMKEHDETGRDYIDRDSTVRYNGIAEFERIPKEKPAKPKKDVNLNWLKPVLSVVAIIISIIIAIFLFNFIKDFQSNEQVLDTTKNEYIEFVELTNSTLLSENTTCKEFKNITEQFVIDAISKDVYLEQIATMKTALMTEMSTYSLKTYEKIDVYDIKTLTVDYIKAVLNVMDKILAAKDEDANAIKSIVLSDVNDGLSTREQQFNNIIALINDTSVKYDLESELKEGIVYFNVEK